MFNLWIKKLERRLFPLSYEQDAKVRLERARRDQEIANQHREELDRQEACALYLERHSRKYSRED